MSRSVQGATVVAAILIFVGVWYFAFRTTSPGSVANYPSSGTDIIAFGDSLVAGNGSTHGNDFVSVLSKKTGQTIVNLGVPGDTTAAGLARLHELDQYHPKVVLLLLGGNDHLRNVPTATTFANLSTIIENIESRGAIVLLLGVKGSLFGDQFAPEFERLHTKYNTAFVSNVLEGLFGKEKYMSDEVHPNDLGYTVIADRVYPVLVPLLN
ncbi:MAG: Acyl-CoA thioesterase [Parcubacteria group bacterium]|nr:Acyl-CoA thioesterase [Parcubacteria group bacterium]